MFPVGQFRAGSMEKKLRNLTLTTATGFLISTHPKIPFLSLFSTIRQLFVLL